MPSLFPTFRTLTLSHVDLAPGEPAPQLPPRSMLSRSARFQLSHRSTSAFFLASVHQAPQITQPSRPCFGRAAAVESQGSSAVEQGTHKPLVGSSILPSGTNAKHQPSMANIKSAAKRARQTKVRTARNRSTLSSLKTLSRKSQTALEAKDKTAAAAQAREFSSELDRAVKSGTIHRNAANRRKSSLARKLAAL